MIPFNWFDVLLFFILVSSAITGLRVGLARVVVGLIALAVAFLMAFWCYRLIAVELLRYVGTPGLANILGFLCIFIGILILGSLVAAALSHVLKWIGLSWFNHFLGGVAGIVRGTLIIAVLIDAIVAFSPSPTPAFLNDSQLVPYATLVSTWLAAATPRELKDAFDAQMESLRQLWTPQQRRNAQEI